VSQRRPCIAIDGPVAAGKSTIARLVAQALHYTYIDSGAMYRALAWAARRRGIGPDEPDRVSALLASVDIRLLPQPDGLDQVLLDGRDVTNDIRTPDISQLSSQLSEIPEVRKQMVALQQAMARSGGVVMEGRDIQTVVLPDAEIKIFLIAPARERARRRWLELCGRGLRVDLDGVLADIEARDRRDANRAHSPLRAAPDAVHLDTGGLTIAQVAEAVLAIIRQPRQEDGSGTTSGRAN
jgi:cytidylate kinase